MLNHGVNHCIKQRNGMLGQGAMNQVSCRLEGAFLSLFERTEVYYKDRKSDVSDRIADHIFDSVRERD